MEWTDATLPNGMRMRLPGHAFEAELPYAAGVSGADPTAFAAAASVFSTNPALAMAARDQARMKAAIARRISGLEGLVHESSRRVASAMFDLQRASRAAAVAQRQAFLAQSALAAGHRQLAALDVNTRRIADTARITDLKRALALTQASLGPGYVMTESQRVVNAQLAAAIRDQVRTEAVVVVVRGWTS
jgi:hypothetical protein